jgi:glycosyltransferase 2 family protein
MEQHTFKRRYKRDTKMNKKLKLIFQIMIITAVFSFMFWQVYKNWNSLQEYEWSFNYIYLVLSFIFLGGYYFCIFIGWHFILKKLGVKIGFLKTMKIRALSELGRYIPGKFWHLLGRTYFAKKMKLPVLKIVTSFVLELSISLIAGFVVFLSVFPFFLKTELMIKVLPFAIIAIPLGLAFIHPKILNRLLNFALKVFKRGKIKIQMKYRYILLLVMMYCAFWLVAGFAFFLLVNSIYSISFSNVLVIGSIYVIAWVLGFLSFLTPGGMGVREGVLAALLSLYMPLPIAIIISLISRLWSIAMEFMLAGAVLKVKI